MEWHRSLAYKRGKAIRSKKLLQENKGLKKSSIFLMRVLYAFHMQFFRLQFSKSRSSDSSRDSLNGSQQGVEKHGKAASGALHASLFVEHEPRQRHGIDVNISSNGRHVRNREQFLAGEPLHTCTASFRYNKCIESWAVLMESYKRSNEQVIKFIVTLAGS